MKCEENTFISKIIFFKEDDGRNSKRFSMFIKKNFLFHILKLLFIAQDDNKLKILKDSVRANLCQKKKPCFENGI